MTFQEFLTKWNGKYIDTDNAYGAQCMDLMHQYCVEVFGLEQSVLAAPSAKQAYETGNDLFTKTPNTPTDVPQEGDIVFWTNEPYGHVAIFIEGDVQSFRSFDQNYPTGSPCHVQNHTYASVGGWLHYKGSVNLQVQLSQSNTERDRNWTWFTAVCEALGVGANVDAAVAEAKKLVGNDDVLVIRDKQIAEANTHITDLQGKLTELQTKNDTLTIQVKEISDLSINQNEALTNALKEVDELKKQVNQPAVTGWRKVLIDIISRL